MSDTGPPNRVPHLWLKVALLMAGIVVGELGFLIARSAGIRWLEIVSVCLGVLIVAGAMAWVVRDGRHLRAAGHKPDFEQLEHRLRRHLKWEAVLVTLSLITTVVLLTADRPRAGPTWPIILGPSILILGLGWLWVLVRFLLPYARRRHRAHDGG